MNNNDSISKGKAVVFARGDSSILGQLQACREYAQSHNLVVEHEIVEQGLAAQSSRLAGITAARGCGVKAAIERRVGGQGRTVSGECKPWTGPGRAGEFDRGGHRLLSYLAGEPEGHPEGLSGFRPAMLAVTCGR